jgi:hypothetical protein
MDGLDGATHLAPHNAHDLKPPKEKEKKKMPFSLSISSPLLLPLPPFQAATLASARAKRRLERPLVSD